MTSSTLVCDTQPVATCASHHIPLSCNSLQVAWLQGAHLARALQQVENALTCVYSVCLLLRSCRVLTSLLPPPPAALSRKRVRLTDTSASFAAGLAAALPAMIDTVADFRRELAARLPGPVIVQSGQVSLLSEGTAVLYLEEADGSYVMVKIEELFVGAWLRPVTGGTEEVWASKADDLVGVVLTMLDHLTGALGATSNRNAVDPSGTTDVRMRPDYWLLVLGALLLKAEHKRSRGELGDAKAELASRMNGWNTVALRGLAFLPCFAVGGELLQFCAVVRTADGSLAVEDASPVFNMTVDLDRMRIVCAACNMFRVLVALRRRMPAKVPPLYTAQIRSCGSSITVMDTYVVKKCWPAPDGVYACLEGEGSIPCAIRVISRVTPAGGGMMHIKMKPVCVEALPDSEADLQVRRCVGSALSIRLATSAPSHLPPDAARCTLRASSPRCLSCSRLCAPRRALAECLARPHRRRLSAHRL